MNETKTTEKFTGEDETRATKTRAAKIGLIAARLPEKEQEKVYYMIKGIELAGCVKNPESRAAVL